MKVIKIIKTVRGGPDEHFLVLDNLHSELSNDGIDEMVLEYCENDPSGSCYGFSYKWEVVEDEKLIKSVMEKETNIINRKIDYLNLKKEEIVNYLNNIIIK